MEEFIINPNTARQIRVGGPTYNKLLKSGVPVNNRIRFPVVSKRERTIEVKSGKGGDDEIMREIMAMDLFEAPPIAELAKLAKAPYQKRTFKQIKGRAEEGRGSATRGWGLRAPKKGKQRHELMKKCGQKCFLGKGESFPICPSCYLYEGDCQCLIDCEGVQSAFIRAQQWKYPDVSKAAQEILKKKCKRTPKAKRTF